MAKCSSGLLLGYKDELILGSHQVDFTTNKIGGRPDFFSSKNIELRCLLCDLPLALIVQIYAPFENSSYHRNLYVFACVNNNCWNNSKSWQCIRIQSKNESLNTTTNSEIKSNITSNWCNDEDDWGDASENLFSKENITNKMDSLFIAEELDNVNASANGPKTPIPSAEIEDSDDHIVLESIPQRDENNVPSLLFETVPLPVELSASFVPEFKSYFMSVWNEEPAIESVSDSHVNRLLEKYSKEDPSFFNVENNADKNDSYEKVAPVHGDKMFYRFMKRIQANPGQILRYHREHPLLFYPINEQLGKCRYCNGDLTFEFQILPTIIPELILTVDVEKNFRLEFGTALIYSCKNSCWDPSGPDYRIENVIVQKEI